MEEDLLVTNAFYPIATLTEKDNRAEVNVDYKFNRRTDPPYQTENLGPFPNIKMINEKKYDTKTSSDFRQYLKKKNKTVDNFNTDTNAQFMDTMMERGNMPIFSSTAHKDRVLKIKKYNMTFDTTLRDDIEMTNNYTVDLPFTLYNIKYVKLTASEIPYPEDAQINSPFWTSIDPTPFNYMFLASTVLNNTVQPQNDYNTISNSDKKNVQGILVNFGILGRIQLADIPSPTTVIFNGFIDPTITVFDPPMPSLTSFDIQLLNPDGSFYDVGTDNQGNPRNTSFALEFTTYVDEGLNTNISSRRGIQDKSSYESHILLQ
jgi:hypothetical protein